MSEKNFWTMVIMSGLDSCKEYGGVVERVEAEFQKWGVPCKVRLEAVEGAPDKRKIIVTVPALEASVTIVYRGDSSQVNDQGCSGGSLG